MFGAWELRVDDVKPGDGGTLLGWELVMDSDESPLTIDLEFRGSLTESQRDVFRMSIERLQRILVGVEGEPLHLTIEASGVEIDGPSGILGQAGPTMIRRTDQLPTRGIMQFDSADLAGMERDGSLPSVLIHEAGHVLGFGTLFGTHQLVESGAFMGSHAQREYAMLMGEKFVVPVPIEDDGGAGTRGGHWDEEVFGTELFTGWLNAGLNPFSRVSAGAFADMGYRVDFLECDPYTLGMRMLAASPLRTKWRGCAAPEWEYV
jgi:hypothetical protein